METIKKLKEICQPHRAKAKHPNDWGYLRHRELSIYITRFILRLTGGKIKPNHLSIFNIFFGLFLLLFIAMTRNQATFILLLILFYFSFLLDKVDGEIARYKDMRTLRGAYLDEVYHLFVQNGLILAIAASKDAVCVGVVGFLLFFLVRYVNKIRYFIYAKYRPERDEVPIKKNLSKAETLLVGLLNILPLKLCSIARRHDIFLVLVFVLAVLYFNSTIVWFWFLLGWSAMLMVNVLRFLSLNYLHIDRDVQLVDKNKL